MKSARVEECDGEGVLPEGKRRPGCTRGPLPGTRHAGSFKPGGDSRQLAGGKNNPIYQLKQAATTELIGMAIDAYRKVLADPSHKDYAAVARDVLNRNEGSPITQLQKRAEEAIQAGVDPKELSEADLLKIVSNGVLIEGEIEPETAEAE